MNVNYVSCIRINHLLKSGRNVSTKVKLDLRLTFRARWICKFDAVDHKLKIWSASSLIWTSYQNGGVSWLMLYLAKVRVLNFNRKWRKILSSFISVVEFNKCSIFLLQISWALWTYGYSKSFNVMIWILFNLSSFDGLIFLFVECHKIGQTERTGQHEPNSGLSKDVLIACLRTHFSLFDSYFIK